MSDFSKDGGMQKQTLDTVGKPPDAKREGEQQRTVFIVYRDNELFRAHMQQVTDALKAMDITVEAHAFPAGTEEQAMIEWATEHRAELMASGTVVTDVTIDKVLSKARIYLPPSASTRLGLDGLFAEASVMTLLESEDTEALMMLKEGGKLSQEEKITQTRDFFIKIIRKLITKQGQPDKVIITLEHLNSHGPFRKWGDWDEKHRQMTEDEAENMIREWLVESGIKSQTIVSVADINYSQEKGFRLPESSNTGATEDLDTDGCWVLADRHSASSMNMYRHARRAILLELPIESLFSDLIKKRLVPIEPEKLAENLGKVIAHEFTPPKTE